MSPNNAPPDAPKSDNKEQPGPSCSMPGICGPCALVIRWMSLVWTFHVEYEYIISIFVRERAQGTRRIASRLSDLTSLLRGPDEVSLVLGTWGLSILGDSGSLAGRRPWLPPPPPRTWDAYRHGCSLAVVDDKEMHQDLTTPSFMHSYHKIAEPLLFTN